MADTQTNGEAQHYAEALARNHSIVRNTYDEYAHVWDSRHAEDAANTEIENFLSKWDWNGSILDLACGTGRVGAMLKKQCPSAKLFGSDISPQMADVASKKDIYEGKVRVSTVTDDLSEMASTPVDHVLCWGAVNHLDPREFKVALDQMFNVARQSVTFSIDDPTNFREIVGDDPVVEVWHDHMATWTQAATPPGWNLVASELILSFLHPPTGIYVYLRAIRYEKI